MSPTPFTLLKPLAGRALEAALNRAVALDPDSHDALAALEGRRIALSLESPPLALEIVVAEQHLHVGPVREHAEADLSVRGTLGGLLSQLPFARPERGTPAGKLRISGDADLARRLQTLASRFDPDWVKPFTDVLGDVIGVQVAQAVQAALRQAQVRGAELARTSAEYVTEESRDVVPRAELSAFHDDVDALRDDVERLAARIQRLGLRA
jgi:ubiquinone biosynthesis accessory factor UbiJ